MKPEAIYKQLDTATKDVHAWAVTKRGKFVAKIVTKYTGRDNPNGVSCRAWVHVLGLPMATGKTGPGGGYDMKTDAIATACRKLPATWPEYRHKEDRLALRALLDLRDGMKCQGADIPTQLRKLGYDVLEVL